MKINSKIERLIEERTEIAEKEHRIISAKDCYRGNALFLKFYDMTLDGDMDIEKIKYEIDKVINEISKSQTLWLSFPGSRSRIPLKFQNDKEITIEEYQKNGEECFYKTVEECPEIYIFKREKKINHLFVQVLEEAEKNHKIISLTECCRGGKYFSFFEELIDNDNGDDIEKVKYKMNKFINEISKLDTEDLNNKESIYRLGIPLKFQTNKKITIEDYHKNKEKCFYKISENYTEIAEMERYRQDLHWINCSKRKIDDEGRIIYYTTCYEDDPYNNLSEVIINVLKNNDDNNEKYIYEMDKVVTEVSKCDSQNLNNKENLYHSGVPLEYQIDKKFIVKEHHFYLKVSSIYVR